MASGFIIFKDGRCFARRWTGYDEIIQIAIKELYLLDDGQKLADWLQLQIPDSNYDENDEAGWGFYKSSVDQWITRYFDLRSLTIENQNLFWKAIQNGRINLIEKASQYSTLSFDYFEVFYKMFECAENGEPPMELTHWNKLAEPCEARNGPGWE